MDLSAFGGFVPLILLGIIFGFLCKYIAKLKGKSWYIEANFKKPDGDISDNLDVSFVLGFSDETISEIVEMIEPMINEKLLKSYGIL